MAIEAKAEHSNVRPHSGSQGGTVPVPNAVLDVLMPMLRDTELRVLLVVIRQTLGWQEQSGGSRRSNQRKWRDYISHSQLCRKTGRASAAVSSAIDSLVKQGHIVVEDIAGRALSTSEERRRHLAHWQRLVGVRVVQRGFHAAQHWHSAA